MDSVRDAVSREPVQDKASWGVLDNVFLPYTRLTSDGKVGVFIISKKV